MTGLPEVVANPGGNTRSDDGLVVEGLTVVTETRNTGCRTSFRVARGHVLGLVGESGSGEHRGRGSSGLGAQRPSHRRREVCIAASTS
jgi:hypothetical protein